MQPPSQIGRQALQAGSPQARRGNRGGDLPVLVLHPEQAPHRFEDLGLTVGLDQEPVDPAGLDPPPVLVEGARGQRHDDRPVSPRPFS